MVLGSLAAASVLCLTRRLPTFVVVAVDAGGGGGVHADGVVVIYYLAAVPGTTMFTLLALWLWLPSLVSLGN